MENLRMVNRAMVRLRPAQERVQMVILIEAATVYHLPLLPMYLQKIAPREYLSSLVTHLQTADQMSTKGARVGLRGGSAKTEWNFGYADQDHFNYGLMKGYRMAVHK